MFDTLGRGLCLLTGNPMSNINIINKPEEELSRDDAGGIIAAGPITKQPGTAVFRTVLRVLSTPLGFTTQTEFVVHYQIWDDQHTLPDGSLSIHPAGGCHFEEGQYFTRDKLVEATAAFAKRVANDAASVGSIYREATQAEVDAEVDADLELLIASKAARPDG